MFQAKIISNSQNEKGDVETIIEYSSDNVKAFQEVIPSDANGSSVSNTIQNHLTQLQGAEDFVNANPAGTVIEATPSEITK